MNAGFEHVNKQDIVSCGIKRCFHRKALVFWTVHLIALACNQKASGKAIVEALNGKVSCIFQVPFNSDFEKNSHSILPKRKKKLKLLENY